MERELFELVAQAKQGQTEAFAQLMKRYKNSIYRHAYAMLNDRTDAEDLTQETFVKAYYGLPKLASPYAFRSWLTRILANLCYDRLQKRKTEGVLIGDILHEQVSVSPMEQVQDRLSLEEAMQKLSTEHREAIILRDLHGFSYEEMADFLQVPLGTVKSRIHLARLALRNELTQ